MKPSHRFLFFLSVLGLAGFIGPEKIRDDFKKYFDEQGVQGSFMLYDTKNDAYTYCNKEQARQSYLPASTFKICNSLIGLETGVIKDEKVVLKWDSVQRSRPEWNQDQNLASAYRYSAVWYYQDMARKIGEKRMQYWLTKIRYGNATMTGGIDLFWLKGGLRITPQQQVDFLRRLHANQLPFSQRSMDIVKRIMIEKQTNTYTIRSKTGWTTPENQHIGWYVGYIETADNIYYFSTCVQKEGEVADMRKITIPITYQILTDLNVIKPD